MDPAAEAPADLVINPVVTAAFPRMQEQDFQAWYRGNGRFHGPTYEEVAARLGVPLMVPRLDHDRVVLAENIRYTEFKLDRARRQQDPAAIAAEAQELAGYKAQLAAVERAIAARAEPALLQAAE